MTGPDTALGVIAARGGSKGLPGKNLADLGGRPLVAWSVAAARQARQLDRVIVSSDDPSIIAAAAAAGCDAPFVRPADLAADDSSIYDVLFHALDMVEEVYGYVVLLQATSPFRTGADIDACLDICRGGAPACVSVVSPAKSPYWMYRLDAAGRLNRLLDVQADQRQQLPPVVMPNGAVYAARVDWLRQSRNFMGPETRAYVMPPERSVDIDTPLDLALARALAAQSTA